MKIEKRKITLSLLVLLAGFVGIADISTALIRGDVSSKVVCQCGCALVLENCNHQGCPVATPMREYIDQAIARGEGEDQIIGYFVAQYGEVVLAAPTKEGFNLTAWIFPFLGIGIGAGGIYLAIIKWSGSRGEIERGEDENHRETGGVEGKYLDRFERELKDFEEE